MGTTRRAAIVLVTGVGGGGLGHEIVKALRLADRWTIVAADVSPVSLGFQDADASIVVPVASAPDYVNALLGAARAHGARAVLPGSEAELKVLSRERRRFEDEGIAVLVNAPGVIDLALDKSRTFARLRELGIWVPDTVAVPVGGEVPTMPLPVVVKPSVGGGGSSHTYVAQSLDELRVALDTLRAAQLPAVVQEYVGTPDSEFTVGVLHDRQGVLVGSIALRRRILSGLSNRAKAANRTSRAELSDTLAISSGVSQGTVERAPELCRQAEAIAAALGSRGPLNVQCRFVEGRLCLFEINPRFSGTTHIRALLGFNEPDMVLGDRLLGEAYPRPPRHRFGTVLRGLREEIVALDPNVD